MTSTGRETETGGMRKGVFATTHWSVVLAAGRAESPQATEALEKLCQTYWYPLYAYVRRCGYRPEDAQDLIQEFFARLLAQGSLARADQARGRFRSFLLGAVKHVLADENAKARAKKRGGELKFVSSELARAEERLGAEPLDRLSPDIAGVNGIVLFLQALAAFPVKRMRQGCRGPHP